ncbi:hypothetical protein ACWDRB_40205 [Nonomuraea sp. NPDC003707]
MVQRAKKTIERGDFASTLLVAVPEPSLPAGRAPERSPIWTKRQLIEGSGADAGGSVLVELPGAVWVLAGDLRAERRARWRAEEAGRSCKQRHLWDAASTGSNLIGL